jgi:hypothetical protein
MRNLIICCINIRTVNSPSVLTYSFLVLHITDWWVKADVQRRHPQIRRTSSQSETVSFIQHTTLHVSTSILTEKTQHTDTRLLASS